jgi:predicted helicase
MVEKNGEGIIAMITAHGYIDNPTFRGMRWHLRKTFDVIYILDLHGNTTKKETSPDGSPDTNVFDIKTGVSIIFGIKKQKSGKEKKLLATVYTSDLYGKRVEKFEALADGTIETICWNELPVDADAWTVEGMGKGDYKAGFSVNTLFLQQNTGIVSKRDWFCYADTEVNIRKVGDDILNLSENEVKIKYQISKDTDWELNRAIADIKSISASKEFIKPISYRPFETKFTYYTGVNRGFLARPVEKIAKHFHKIENLALITSRQGGEAHKEDWTTLFISKGLIDLNFNRRGGANSFPLYLYENGEKVPNLDRKIVKEIGSVVGTTAPEDILDYVYAVLHSPAYREKYGEFLKTDFPRVPYPTDKEEFWKLVPLGTKLRNLHLLTDPQINRPITSFPVAGSDVVEKPIWKGWKVYINDEQYWDGAPEAVWNFYIGGYQPAQKYLKDRKGRTLTTPEFENYEKMIVSLNETIKVMAEIDTVFKI